MPEPEKHETDKLMKALLKSEPEHSLIGKCMLAPKSKSMGKNYAMGQALMKFGNTLKGIEAEKLVYHTGLVPYVKGKSAVQIELASSPVQLEVTIKDYLDFYDKTYLAQLGQLSATIDPYYYVAEPDLKAVQVKFTPISITDTDVQKALGKPVYKLHKPSDGMHPTPQAMSILSDAAQKAAAAEAIRAKEAEGRAHMLKLMRQMTGEA
jgi:hypothetical protein